MSAVLLKTDDVICEKDWVVWQDGGKLRLFRERKAVLASHGPHEEFTLFVLPGFEEHADLDLARLYLQRSGRKISLTQSVDQNTLAELVSRAKVSEGIIRPCLTDRHLFWSKSKNNRRCSYCLKHDTEDDWEW
jgi:hypothetical protein